MYILCPLYIFWINPVNILRADPFPCRAPPHVAAGYMHVAAGSWILSNLADVSSQIGQCRNWLEAGGNGRKRRCGRSPHTVSLPPNRTFASYTSTIPFPSNGPKATEATIMPLFREATIMTNRTYVTYPVRGLRACCIWRLTVLEGSLRGSWGRLECWLSAEPIIAQTPRQGPRRLPYARARRS